MKGERKIRVFSDPRRADKERETLLRREEIVSRGLIPPTPTRFGFVDDRYPEGSRMRVLGYSIEEDGSVSVTIFEPPEESEEELKRRGWKALDKARTNGKKGGQSRWCDQHRQSVNDCSCPPWKEQAHRLNAALMVERPTLNGNERAGHISKKIELAFRTVQGELSSPEKRAKYNHLYPIDSTM